MKPTIYLAGAIRDGNEYDWQWREDAMYRLRDTFNVLSPLAGKEYLEDKWTMHRAQTDNDMIVHRDLHMIHKSDFLLANLLPLADGYPSMGTLMELGVALELRKLVVLVGGFAICQHPFIKSVAYRRVASVDLAIEWLKAEAETWAL